MLFPLRVIGTFAFLCYVAAAHAGAPAPSPPTRPPAPIRSIKSRILAILNSRAAMS